MANPSVSKTETQIRSKNLVSCQAAAALLLLFLSSGCSFPQQGPVIGLSVSPSSSEVTHEAYRNRDIVVAVPPGNRNELQPELPPSVLERFGSDPIQSAPKIEAKYQSVVRSLLQDKKTIDGIKRASQILEIDPMLVLGCIIGEHTYNVSATDSIQTYAVVAASWAAKWALKFKSNDVNLIELVKEPAFSVCDRWGPQAEYWDCVGQVWQNQYRGRTKNGVTYENRSLKLAFFNPKNVGTTFGLGQLDPIRALMVTDIVATRIGGKMISIENPVEVYETLINPASGVSYIAANVRLFIDRYREIARFDISANPGIVATLYNLGAEKGRASQLYRGNVENLRRGEPLKLPEENYYGWFINKKEAEIRRLFAM